jgi:TrmH family RNA methyltransferase
MRKREARSSSKTFIIEGPHLLQRALECELSIAEIIATKDAYTKNHSLIASAASTGAFLGIISDAAALQIADTESPQGLFAVIWQITSHVPDLTSDVIIALDAVQDPGNVGTIIRTASWFGVGEVILGKGSADCFGQKTLRASQGEVFAVSIAQNIQLLPALLNAKKKGYRVLSVTSSPDAGSYNKEIFIPKSIFVFGSEGAGITDEIEQMSDVRITITRRGKGESLNVSVSAGIILAHFIDG